ncbi:signal recognition particle-docking protein FtsY [Polycladidibacter stylochi]|uniref:signal recognition particle-docking protein FtsY n=1 Tax=Polycladidibacter stylochi TaxID=1807766 RepID=UPI000830E0FE|nr:signal recognition particle-docking protein FtsY [Pseudovibrio stylochi]
MSEKKRGFFGRLFGGNTEPAEAEQPSEEKAVADASLVESKSDSETPNVDVVEAATASKEPVKLDTTPDVLVEPEHNNGDADTLQAADEAEQELEAITTDDEAQPTPMDALVEQAEPPQEAAEELPQEPATESLSWFQRLKAGLSRSSSSLTEGISSIFTKRKLDAQTLEELEDILIQADLGIDTAMTITERVADGRYDKEISGEEVRRILAEEVEAVLAPVAKPLDLNTGHSPHVVLMVGVNGTGKTTSIGKLAHKLAGEGKKVMMAAGDTFRAAAVEQLKVWGERTGAEVIARDTGADAAGLAFDAIAAAKAQGADVLLIDTAGRLQNKAELMEELKKIIRVIKKHDETAPHSVLLSLDATTGQNALNQVEIFGKEAGVTGLIMTKLDGTARGGILVAIAKKYGLPVHFIGVGEGMDHLEPFEAQDFAKAIAGMAE